MVFSNLFFLYVFIPLFFICYSIFNKNIIICLFSFIFYAWGEPIYVFLLIFSIFINYIVGLKIENANNKKTPLVIGVAINILFLVIFKYANFITGLLFKENLEIYKTNIRLPLGISFYTFQAISYIVDVYNGKVSAQKNYLNLFLYISMFPQLIAGPIVRYNTVADDIEKRFVSSSDKLYGAQKFICGLGKKVIIANQLSVIVKQFLETDITSMSKIALILGVIIFLFELYFDFSGYSDMAIGLGALMGFHFEENFDFPFISKNITEFWRRWHMTLGHFFRDYVYIPLGGNRKHQVRNIIVVWFLTGVWHGASMNFVLWGVFFAIVMVVEKYIIGNVLKKLPQIFQTIYFWIMIYISFSIFYFDDVRNLMDYAVQVVSTENIFDLYTKNILINNIILILISIFFAFPLSVKFNEMLGRIIKNNTVMMIFRIIFLSFILVYSTILLIGNTSNPFLYFRF